MYIGPKIVTDGLVLHLDAGNSKSFKGEPTTNVVANSIPTSSWTVANFGGSTTTRTFLSENGISFMRFTDVINASDYPRMVDSVFTNTITGIFSVSMEVRGTPNAQLRFRIYENGSTKITNTITLTSEWTRVEFNNQTTSFILNQPYFNPVTTGATYDIRNIQVEAKPYATPYVNGTRGTTVATGGGWVDRSGNNNHGDLTNSPIFSSDSKGGLVFDSTDDLITLGTNMYLYTYDSSYTIEAFIKLNTISRLNGIIGDLQYDYWSFRVDSNNKLVLRHRLNDITQNQLISNSILESNKYYHCVGIFDKLSGLRLYINGVLDNSNTNTTIFGLNSSTRGPRFIGQNRTGDPSTPQVFSGTIYTIKLYNRTLSDLEVFENFNSIKSRFGI